MKRSSVGGGAALAITLLSLLPSPAAARLDGTDRQTFVKANTESCSGGLRARAKFSAKQIEAYCSCVAESEADIITDADIEYTSTHDQPPPGQAARIQAFAAACAAKAGIK